MVDPKPWCRRHHSATCVCVHVCVHVCVCVLGAGNNSILNTTETGQPQAREVGREVPGSGGSQLGVTLIPQGHNVWRHFQLSNLGWVLLAPRGAARAAYSTGQKLWIFRNIMQKNSNELSGQLNTTHGTSPQQSDPDPNVGGAEAEGRGPPCRPPRTYMGGSTTMIFVCQVLCWVFHTPLRTSECLLHRSHVHTCYTAHVCTHDVPLTCIHTFIPLTTSTGLGSQTLWVQIPCGHFLAGEAQAS